MLTLWCSHSHLVSVLERELADAKHRAEHERERAERAVDELLRMRVQAGPVTPMTPQMSAAEAQIERMVRDTEFTGAGE